MILAALIVLIIAGAVVIAFGFTHDDDTVGFIAFIFGLLTVVLGIICLIFHSMWYAQGQVPWL